MIMPHWFCFPGHRWQYPSDRGSLRGACSPAPKGQNRWWSGRNGSGTGKLDHFDKTARVGIHEDSVNKAATALTIEKHMRDICPFRIGQRVRVAPTYRYASFFPDVYVVIGMRWEIELGGGAVSIKLANDANIEQGCGHVGKFRPDDLVPA